MTRKSPNFITDIADDTRFQALLASIFGNSPFLSHCLLSDMGFARDIFTDGPEKSLKATLAAQNGGIGIDTDTGSVMAQLRRARRRVALSVGILDITGLWPLELITGALSQFADTALETAVSHLLLDGHKAGEIGLTDPADPSARVRLYCAGDG